MNLEEDIKIYNELCNIEKFIEREITNNNLKQEEKVITNGNSKNK